MRKVLYRTNKINNNNNNNNNNSSSSGSDIDDDKKLTRRGGRTKLYFLLPRFVFPSVITTSTLETPLRSPPAGEKSAELASSRALSVRVPPPV